MRSDNSPGRGNAARYRHDTGCMSGERYIRARRRRAWHLGARRGGAERGAVLPARRTDRLEDLVAWLLVSLGLLAGLGAVFVGAAAHRAALGPSRLGDARPVSVVLLADVPPAPA